MVDEDINFKPETEEGSSEAETNEALDPGEVKPPASKKRGLGVWLGYSALILVLVLVAAGVFLLRELRSQQEGLGSGLSKGDKQIQSLLEQISGLQTELAAVHQQLANVQSNVATEESKFEREIGQEGSTLNEKLEAMRKDMGGSIQHIQHQLNESRGDIMVADAEYLISVANQKLHLVGDVKAVIEMMEAADQRLHDSGDPAAFKVREALAQEINQLKEFNPPDVVGISAKLLALEAKVKDLPLFLPHSERQKEDHHPAAANTGAEAETGKKSWPDTVLKDIKGMVTLRHTDRPVQAVLLPEEVAALRQILLLKLEMSRSALLRGDDELYSANMDSALAWLTENFDTDAAMTQSFVQDLKAVQNLQLKVPFPDISKSLSLIRNIEKLRLESEKGAKIKQEKPAPKPEAVAPEPPAVMGPPTPPATSQPEAEKLPVAEPIQEEGAKP